MRTDRIKFYCDGEWLWGQPVGPITVRLMDKPVHGKRKMGDLITLNEDVENEID